MIIRSWSLLRATGDKKDVAVRLIEGAERVAEQMVDQQWDRIEVIALALKRMGGVVERDSIRQFLKRMPRVIPTLTRRGHRRD
jgi:hypothetical protein